MLKVFLSDLLLIVSVLLNTGRILRHGKLHLGHWAHLQQQLAQPVVEGLDVHGQQVESGKLHQEAEQDTARPRVQGQHFQHDHGHRRQGWQM